MVETEEDAKILINHFREVGILSLRIRIKKYLEYVNKNKEELFERIRSVIIEPSSLSEDERERSSSPLVPEERRKTRRAETPMPMKRSYRRLREESFGV